MDAIENPGRSKKEGRPIFDECEMVEVRIPGDKLFVFVSPVEDHHKERWPAQYEAFQRGEARAASGTPLEHWTAPTMTRGRVAELKAANILSVEELSNVPDNALPRLGVGARELRDQARAYLAQAKDGAATAAQAAENAALKAQMAALQEQMAQLLTNKSGGKIDTAPAERAPEDLSDEELRAYITRETGKPVPPKFSRDLLIARATEIATKEAA
jgi:hypothetical protein